jgi:hypothetical protein
MNRRAASLDKRLGPTPMIWNRRRRGHCQSDTHVAIAPSPPGPSLTVKAWSKLPHWQQAVTAIVGFAWYANQISSPHNQALELLAALVRLAHLAR